ncbi:hypothetical protein FQR65_LT09891 [Abscondita terminalis]|nr:hypothetical protein FQR65_LT09891 [Abscondita terminalis]
MRRLGFGYIQEMFEMADYNKDSQDMVKFLQARNSKLDIIETRNDWKKGLTVPDQKIEKLKRGIRKRKLIIHLKNICFLLNELNIINLLLNYLALSLGTGLVVFASVLSETVLEATQYHKKPHSEPLYDYRYGWCFFAAGAAFIMTKLAAVFTLTGYINRFPSVDEMVREMVPGADRKLREHQRLSTEYLVKHAGSQHRQQYDPICTDRPKYECECGPLLNKTPPDVCTMNKSMEFGGSDISTTPLAPGIIEQNFTTTASTLVGQTVPIQIKNHATTTLHSSPFSYSNFSCNKYGTIPHSGITVHQGFLGVAEIGSSSSNSSSSYCSKSKTLQHQRPKKKCVKIETFQTPDTGFVDFTKRSSTFGYSGSAV